MSAPDGLAITCRYINIIHVRNPMAKNLSPYVAHTFQRPLRRSLLHAVVHLIIRPLRKRLCLVTCDITEGRGYREHLSRMWK